MEEKNTMIENIITILLSSIIIILITIFIKKKNQHQDKIKLSFKILGYILAGVLLLITALEATIFRDFYTSNYSAVRIMDNTIYLLFLIVLVICIILNLKKSN